MSVGANWYPDPYHGGYERWFDGVKWTDDWRPAVGRPVQPVVTSYVPVELLAPAGPNAALVVVAWMVALFSILYMLPWAVAASMNSRNQLAVLLINFFLGWTVVGWIVALVLAFAGPAPRVLVGPAVSSVYPPSTPYPPPPTGW